MIQTSLLILLCITANTLVTAEPIFTESWKVHPPYNGVVPKKSDVIFTTRFKRDNAPQIASEFGATRIEWVYTNDIAFSRKLKKVAPWFGGTLNASTPLANDEGVAKDFDGNPIVAPWAKSWGAKWITTANPNTQKTLRSQAKKYIELGANSIQIDEPLLQYRSAAWGGDFSQSSLAGFTKFLMKKENSSSVKPLGLNVTKQFNYKEFLQDNYAISSAKEYQKQYKNLPTTPLWLKYLMESVKSHHTDFRSYVNGIQPTPISMNLPLYGPDENKAQFELVPYADYAMVETKINDPYLLALQAATYRSLGLGWAPSIQPLSTKDNRVAIARIYALGGQPLVPWDTFVSNGAKKPSRYFGTPKEYADLYLQAKNNAALLNDHESLAVVGLVIPVDAFLLKKTLKLVRRLERSRVPFAIVPVGGQKKRYKINVDQLKQYKLLISVNQRGDYDDAEIELIKSSNTPFTQEQKLTSDKLNDLSPFICKGCKNVSLYVRSNEEGHISTHVIQAPIKGNNNDTCDKIIGFKEGTFNSLRIKNTITLSQTQPEIMNNLVEIHSCDEWNILEYTDQN